VNETDRTYALAWRSKKRKDALPNKPESAVRESTAAGSGDEEEDGLTAAPRR
jgi:hypothetical protein